MPPADVTHLIERASRDHLILRVTHRAADGSTGPVEPDPLAIRFNKSGHRVLWCWSRDAGHIEELLWDGIEGATETGEVFPPRPWVEQ